MPTSKDPESRLDRVARDLSRTLLHGARPADTDGNVRPAAVLTGQQIRVDVPLGDLNFAFTVGVSNSQLTVDHTQAADTDRFMTDAIGKDSAKYLSLSVDPNIPTWVFQQRQFSLTNPPVTAESVPVGTVTVAKIPSSALNEVWNHSEESYVSLWSIDPMNQKGTLISTSKWQPAIFLRFPLRVTNKPAAVPDGTKVYELVGTPEGDRWFLDQLGLLPGPVVGKPPDIAGISLTLEKKDAQGKLLRTPALAEWSIARTNLTQESRPAELMELAIGAPPPPPAFPYIVLSGDPGQDQDALRLLSMASITNSGGYYLAGATDWTDAESLILAVLLDPKTDPDVSHKESAWLPPAANAVALASGAAPDVVRFNGIQQIEITPYTPPGTISFGWTRTVPKDPATLEDKFGFGTLSIVDYSATDGTGQAVSMLDAIPVISPMQALPGDQYQALGSRAARGSENLSTQKIGDIPRSSAMRLLAAHHMDKAAIASDSDLLETHYYRGTLVCYDKKSESPWQRLSDPNRRLISIKPGFRDVFGNRFDAVAGPPFQRRLFYTDPIVSPVDWPGLRFGVYPEIQRGQPSLIVELIYDYNKVALDDNRVQRLRDIRDQLQGVAGDVSVSLLADPLIRGPFALDIQKLIRQLDSWANGDTLLVLPLGSFPCDGAVTDLTQFEPKVRIERKADYLPSDADLPSDQTLAALILKQLTSVTVAIALQTDAAPTAPPKPGDPERHDEYSRVAQKLQSVIAAHQSVQVGFLRDHLNLHEIWLIPNSLFPSVPEGDVSAAWSFATPCPLRNVLGNESFQTPDFTRTSASDPRWKKYGLPLTGQAVVDQDFDELGRIAFRTLESETADLASLIPRANAVTMRSLLKTREDIAGQLATFNGTGEDPGFIVPLLDKTTPGDLDSAALTRIAKDSFFGDLSSFYTVSTILQLPLDKPGNRAIQTFQGKVVDNGNHNQATDPNQPAFSDILLGGGDPKVTILYHLPPQVTGDLPAQPSLTVDISHVQKPLPGAVPGASPFNEGPWIELAEPFALTWKGFPQSIPVAARLFPSKPIIRSAETTLPTLNPGNLGDTPQKINGSNAGLLSKWGWRFSFSVVNGVKKVDTVHVTVRYPQYQPGRDPVKNFILADDWSPVSLINSLFVLKLLRDNWDRDAIVAKRLEILNDLAQSLLRYLSTGPVLSAQPNEPVDGSTDSLDMFTVEFQTPAITNVSRKVMQGPIAVTWTPPTKDTTRVDTATLEALGESIGNNACLTGISPVRGYKLSLVLRRNETFVGQAANRLLVYQCAPVESPVDCRPLNLWGRLIFDMTGQTLESALQAFFDGLFHQADLSRLSMEAGISLVWTKGFMAAATPFSILPADIKPAGGTVRDVVRFVNDKCNDLLGGVVLQPPETDSACIRMRVKITALDKDTPSGPRTLLEAPATDFFLSTTMVEPFSRRNQQDDMAEQANSEVGLRGVEGEIAKALIEIAQKIVQDIPSRTPTGDSAVFPHGIGAFHITASIEPQKINFSIGITDSKGTFVADIARPAMMELASRNIADDILTYCVSLDTADDPVMTDCNAFVKKVGSHFGVAIPDLDADGIVDSFTSAPFTKTTMDPATAMVWAKTGLVVAGMKKSELNPTYGTKYDHGHIAIAHAREDSAHPGFPMASWGSLGSRGKSNTSIRQSFPAAACDDDAVHFAFAPTS